MSKLGTAVDTLVERLETYEARIEELTENVKALTEKVATLEARLVKATTADVGFELVPIRDEATIALAEYRRQLDDVPFSPEADGVTPAMRAEHYAAADAVARAASWVAQSGPSRDKEIYAAIGTGRKALIRLTAMLERRPIPMPLLTADELSGHVNAATDVHTGDRFRWEGDGDAEFLVDRPVPGKPVLLEVVSLGERHLELNVVQVERTDRKLEEHRSGSAGRGLVFRKMARPEVTHLRITGSGSWRARVVQPDELPPMERVTTGQGEAWFRHTLGARKVAIQGAEGGSLEFVPDCTCRGICTNYDHCTPKALTYYSGEFREDRTLPRKNGMLSVSMYPKSVWSVTILR
ncbi:hypothetical protein ABH926_003554 [Catenulispora sp. GP43]|uniref:hypothetical protein n=1 Tax=Catenulispora sp. GP43 TaxID=3156263 RepID=UPI003511966F